MSSVWKSVSVSAVAWTDLRIRSENREALRERERERERERDASTLRGSRILLQTVSVSALRELKDETEI